MITCKECVRSKIKLEGNCAFCKESLIKFKKYFDKCTDLEQKMIIRRVWMSTEMK
jgi:hypothetical protein